MSGTSIARTREEEKEEEEEEEEEAGGEGGGARWHIATRRKKKTERGSAGCDGPRSMVLLSLTVYPIREISSHGVLPTRPLPLPTHGPFREESRARDSEEVVASRVGLVGLQEKQKEGRKSTSRRRR
jgi:hypothetical protein